MRPGLMILVALAAACIAMPVPAQPSLLNLAHQRFVLDNGLTLIVREDHSAPLVTVSVSYRVGSRNEPAGRSGFAHLFEHLMFNGSENFAGEWIPSMRAIGASSVNGWTSFDRTQFFETVPTPALDRVLWMESDRMGHFVGAIDQARLDAQRGVVRNELRGIQAQPYGQVLEWLYQGLFPPGHPYHRPTWGSMADLSSASLDDVRQWFRSYYGPNNAVLVVAGDVTAGDVRARVERYFGDIPAGPEIDGWRSWLPPRQHDTRAIQHRDVAAVLAHRGWAVPGAGARDRALLDIVAVILSNGLEARLHRELVLERQVASSVAAFVLPHEIASVFNVAITLKPGQNASVAGEAMDRIMTGFVEDGPTRAELERAIVRMNASAIRNLENTNEKAAALADGEVYSGDPAFRLRYLQWINNATTEELRDVARRYLSRGAHEIDVLPRQAYSRSMSSVDRSAGPPPVPPTTPVLNFPRVETATLPNGARVVVARRDNIPVVNLAMQFDAGFAADAGRRLGVAGFAMQMLQEGTDSRDALEISAEAERLGASLGSGSTLDTSMISVSALSERLEAAIALWADLIQNANFPADAIERLRSQQIAAIALERADPETLVQRIMPPLLYGAGHAYAMPFTGTGTEESVRAITRADLVDFRDRWLRPDNATIFVVGDTTLAEIRPLLERAFRRWRAPASPLPRRNLAPIASPARSRIFLVDRPGAPQALIVGGLIAPPGTAPNDVAIEAMNDVFGGQFDSRLNMNLREEKHWSYGVRASLREARGPRPYLVQARVQPDRTGDSLRELIREMNEINGARPIREAEMASVVANRVRRLPSSLSRQVAVLLNLMTAANYERPFDYAATLPERYQALSLGDLQAAARELLRPQAVTWVVVGDRAQIEPQITALDMAPIEVLEADGRRVNIRADE